MFLKIFTTVFYLGLFPYFPGTVSSLFAAIIFYLLYKYVIISCSFIASIGGFYQILLFFIVFLGIIVLTSWIIKFYLTTYKIKNTDPQEIVVDEFIGQILLLVLLSLSYDIETNLELYVLLSFILFRLFDIFKPFPILWIENEYESILFDDIVASILAFLYIYLYKNLLAYF